jgi:hypothetical protein
MSKDFQKLLDKLIQSLDWDSILTVHKSFKIGVGEGSEVIPGLKRKPFSETLSKNDIKNELKILCKFVIENDVSKFLYGPWMIFWVNQNWEILDLNEMLEEMAEEDMDEEETESIGQESRLEVIYAPQRISLTIDLGSDQNIGMSTNSDHSTLQKMLDKALAKEDYELAQKLQDILKLTNKDSEIDK